MSFWIKEDLINATEGYSYGDNDWYEAGDETIGSVFKAFQEEYGRCTGKVYVDRPKRFDGPSSPIQVGWVFVKRAEYSDSKDTYLQETWIKVSTTKPYLERKGVTSPWA